MIYTFDIWDTLLRRTCHPDQIKIFSWERAILLNGKPAGVHSNKDLLFKRQSIEAGIAQDWLDKGFDDEYYIGEVFEFLGQEECGSQISFEIELEKERSFPSKAINKKLKNIDLTEIKFISDFYMREEELREILRKSFPQFTHNTIHTSLDYRLNKRSGNLFKELNLMQPWTHYGDNPISDVLSAKRAGARTKLFRPKLEEFRRTKNKKTFEARLSGNINYSKNYSPELKMAIGLLGYCAWINSNSEGDIVFLEREGIFLQKIFKAFSVNNPWNLDAKKNHLLPVSRLSTIGPSFYKNPEETLARIVRQYRDITYTELLKTLGLPETTNSDDFAGLCGIELVTEILLNTGELKKLQGLLKEQATLFDKYFEGKGISRTFTVSDLGWSGTIQSNLEDILVGKNRISGRYLVMRRFAEVSYSKEGFLNFATGGENFNKILRSVRPLEMLFNSRVASTINYLAVDQEVRENRTDVIDSFPLEFEKRQKELLDLIPVASREIRLNLITLLECSTLGLEGMKEFVTKPSPELLNSYLDSIHNETYGLGKFVSPGQAQIRLRDFRLLLNSNRKKLREKYWTVGWPEALAKKSIGFIPPQYLMKLVSKYLWKE
jgi:predicted HAD superfamily hydrolase